MQHWNSVPEGGESLIVNGKGRFFQESFESNQKYNASKLSSLSENMFEKQNLTKLPLATFYVTRGFKYRFRVANPGFTLCPVLVSIDDHDLLIIASDTGSVHPKKAKSFIIYGGERYENLIKKYQLLCFSLSSSKKSHFYFHHNVNLILQI